MTAVTAAAVALRSASLFPIDAVLCAGGLRNILYAFGLGYGLSMMANSALIVVPRLRDLLGVGGPLMGAQHLPIAGGALCFAYGLRLATFLWRRQADASYSSKLSDVRATSQKMPLSARAAITTFVALSQAVYSMPLKLSCDAALLAAPTVAHGVPVVGWAALAVSASGLLLEAAADEQKLSAKRLHPRAPVTTGLYARCRHPNYAGEILFHVGLWGVTAAAPLPQGLLCLGGQAFMSWVMVGAAKRLDAEGERKYLKDAGSEDAAKYARWRSQTGRLIPRVRPWK